LVQEPIACSNETIGTCTGNGTTFYFKINDQEVYIKGANMVPLDYYPDRMKSKDELKWFMEAATAANYNALRIWGGGMYHDDMFYEMADELGLLIWQDMMFSCKFYPYLDKAFIESSKIEVREQAGRLQHHGSIFLWNLNNEVEAMIYWNPENWNARDQYLEQYTGFYIDTITPIMASVGVNLEKNFVDTSPSNGVKSYLPYTKFTKHNPTD
jgi:beta-mannosidase